MRSANLPQTFILDPKVSFAEISQKMQLLGWRQAEATETRPLIKDEPEKAAWSWNEGKPFAIYTFNPVAFLRVLDVATLPPVFRRAIYDALPVLSEQQVDHLFFADKVKDRLLGLWAAQETERVDLIIQSERLIGDADSFVAEQAYSVSQKLKRISDARIETMVNLQILVQAAPEMIRRLDDANFISSLKPKREDIAVLFDECLIDVVMKAADDCYRSNIRLSKMDSKAEIKVTAAPAGLLRWANELSRKFPGAYRDIAGWMKPNHIWLCWTIKSGTTVHYDGLTWVNDHWVWLPKIYRALVPLCLSGRVSDLQVH